MSIVINRVYTRGYKQHDGTVILREVKDRRVLQSSPEKVIGKVIGVHVVTRILRRENSRTIYAMTDLFGREVELSSIDVHRPRVGIHFRHPDSVADNVLLMSIYTQLIRRCRDKKCVSYKSYGAKGITVDKSWTGKHGYLEYRKWAIENGWRKGLTIDRIDNEGGYTPDNCRYVTRVENARKKKLDNIKKRMRLQKNG
jgi:hypothetical protein